jgi:hypothetical protein
MSKIIKADFNNTNITFNSDGWINATEVSNAYGKRLDHWLSSTDTQEYIQELLEESNGYKYPKNGDLQVIDFIKTKKGKNGGTWLHPELVVLFARFISVKFGRWCDKQIKLIIDGDKQQIDWNMQRHAVKSTNKVANAILQMVRAEQGKDTEPHHYANEAKLVNWALTGEFKSVDRDSLSAYDLDLLASLENRNSVLLARGVDRETRKESLAAMAVQYRQSKLLAA